MINMDSQCVYTETIDRMGHVYIETGCGYSIMGDIYYSFPQTHCSHCGREIQDLPNFMELGWYSEEGSDKVYKENNDIIKLPEMVAEEVDIFRGSGVGFFNNYDLASFFNQTEGHIAISDETKYWLGDFGSENFNNFLRALGGEDFEIEEPLYVSVFEIDTFFHQHRKLKRITTFEEMFKAKRELLDQYMKQVMSDFLSTRELKTDSAHLIGFSWRGLRYMSYYVFEDMLDWLDDNGYDMQFDYEIQQEDTFEIYYRIYRKGEV